MQQACFRILKKRFSHDAAHLFLSIMGRLVGIALMYLLNNPVAM